MRVYHITQEQTAASLRKKVKKAIDSHTVAGIMLDVSSKRQQEEVPPC